ncbi:MAG: hypothetical protein JRL30_00815 [Deltaproteobacteria bacterium]|nr:hypothetical protein [Deltaproteobacteria bacterium]
MKGEDFWDAVDEHEELEYVGVTEPDFDEGVRYIRVDHPKTGAKWRITPDAVAKNDWRTLEAIFEGREAVKVIDHMTRIVGYYSSISNWNRSALGNLIDRRKGDYIVTGGGPE